jgi:hypothetical protein
VGGIGTTLASHVKFTGQATISPGWSAGYVLHIEAFTSEPLAWNQATDDGSGGTTGVLQSFWFIKSDTLGKVSVGRQSQASDNTAILVDGSGSLVPANWVLFDHAGFGLRSNGGVINGTWGDIGFCHHIGLGIGGDCNGVTEDVVRYDSPTFGGFSVSGSWGEDDMWDVAARYAGELGGFKVAVAAAYSENTDEGLASGAGLIGQRDSSFFQVGGYVEHVATGVWAYGAYGKENNDQLSSTSNVDFPGFFFPFGFGAGTLTGINPADDGDVWYVKAGLRERWTPLGHTVIYGEYGKRNDMFNGDALKSEDSFCIPGFFCAGNAQRITDSEMRQYGAGVVQEIDAAAMSIYVSWKHFEGEFSGQNLDYLSFGAPDFGFAFTNLTNFKTDIDDFDLIKAGALINF